MQRTDVIVNGGVVLRGSHPAKAFWREATRPCNRLPSVAPEPRYLKYSVLSAAPDPITLKLVHNLVQPITIPDYLVLVRQVRAYCA